MFGKIPLVFKSRGESASNGGTLLRRESIPCLKPGVINNTFCVPMFCRKPKFNVLASGIFKRSSGCAMRNKFFTSALLTTASFTHLPIRISGTLNCSGNGETSPVPRLCCIIVQLPSLGIITEPRAAQTNIGLLVSSTAALTSTLFIFILCGEAATFKIQFTGPPIELLSS